MGLSKQAKKKIDKSSIIEINDIKPFKKLQRTHTNLLVLFAQSGRYFTEDSVRCTDCRNAQEKNQLVLICCFFTRAKEIMCLKISLWELYPTITKFRQSVTTIQCVQLILTFSFETLLLFLFSNSTAWKVRCINLILLTKY